jgi:hypothetical protein
VHVLASHFSPTVTLVLRSSVQIISWSTLALTSIGVEQIGGSTSGAGADAFGGRWARVLREVTRSVSQEIFATDPTNSLWRTCKAALVKMQPPLVDNKVPLLRMVRGLMPHKGADAVWMQLLHIMARTLEATLAQQQTGSKPGPSSGASMQYASKAIVVGARDMDEKLFQYTTAAVNYARGYNTFSISTDKCNPGALSLMNSVICYPSNTMIVCCPVVIRDGGGFSTGRLGIPKQ